MAKKNNNGYGKLHARARPPAAAGNSLPYNFEPSNKLLDFIKAREGFSHTPYSDGYGTVSIGYGVNYSNPRNAPSWITKEKGHDMLVKRVKEKEASIWSNLDATGRNVWKGMKENEKDAVRSAYYNLTERSGNRILANYINGNRVAEIPSALLRYTRSWSPDHERGLLNRRMAEAAMFRGEAIPGVGATIAALAMNTKRGRAVAAREDGETPVRRVKGAGNGRIRVADEEAAPQVKAGKKRGNVHVAGAPAPAYGGRHYPEGRPPQYENGGRLPIDMMLSTRYVVPGGAPAPGRRPKRHGPSA